MLITVEQNTIDSHIYENEALEITVSMSCQLFRLSLSRRLSLLRLNKSFSSIQSSD